MAKRIGHSAVAGLLLGAAFMLAGCGDFFECEHGVATKLLSPDGSKELSYETVACGATTTDATWIELREVPSGKAERVAVFDGKVSRVQWDGNSIMIEAGDARKVRGEDHWHGVAIVYR